MRERPVGDILITRDHRVRASEYDAGQFFPGVTPERCAP